MIIKLENIIAKYNLDISGVIHIGAHWGEEYIDYNKCGIKSMVFVEPVKQNYKMLIDWLPESKDIKTFNCALGSEIGVKEMFIECYNKGQSCSLLEPGTHLKSYPNIKFDEKELVMVNKLDMLPIDRDLYNMINIDVQGYELEVFKGGIGTLDYIDIIYSEVNFEDVYKGCCRVEELDVFLKEQGFARVLTEEKYRYLGWGDALYLKTSKYPQNV
jgi:FkbM family methyltransferase